METSATTATPAATPSWLIALQRQAGLLMALVVFAAAWAGTVLAQNEASSSPPPRSDDSTFAVIDTAESDLEAPIFYDARHIDNNLITRVSTLIGDAVVKYQNITIEAGKITVDMTTRTLTAEAIDDTLMASPDSANAGGQNDRPVEKIGYPVLIDGADRIVGDRMEYNFTTNKGRIVRGRTEFEGGQYAGRQVKRVAPNVLNISGGIYSSCDLEEPHFHFWARKMKLIVHERVIAKPIVLYFGSIPTIILPFGMFPTQTGRRSGLLLPRYGQSQVEGRYLRNVGYYFAINDYMDASVAFDFFERSGWLLRGNYNYALRYNFTGNISGAVTRRNFSDTGLESRRWELSVNHSQTIDKNSNLRISGTFISDNSFRRDFNFDTDERLRRRLLSQATYSKNWPKARVGLSMNLSHERDLETSEEQMNLPQLTLYYSERQIFAPRREPGQAAAPGTGTRWYESIYFRYNLSTQNRISRTIDVDADSALKRETLTQANHDFGLRMNVPGQLFGVLALSQSLSFDEDWFDRARVYEDSSISRSEEFDRGFHARHLFRYSASANTKFYGLFQPRIGPIEAIRHVVTPSLSFNYQPDFSDPFWGYYVEVTDTSGSTQRRDRFAFTGGAPTPSGQLASLNFSVRNLFQMKTRSGDQEKKFDLFSLTFSSGYNFAAEEKQLSNLSTQISANPSRQLSFNATLSHSPYVYDYATRRERNRMLWQDKGFAVHEWFRLTSMTISSSINLRSSGSSPTTMMMPPTSGIGTGTPQFDDERGMLGSDASVPWRANLTLSYTVSRFDPTRPSKSANLTISNVEMTLTQKWRLSFRGQVDLLNRKMVGQNWTILRDLHCWEASFNWNPIGPARGFYFRINVKASHLRDLKFERRGGRSNVFGGGFY